MQTHAMKSDWQTVTENRHMQQSVTLALALRDDTGESVGLPLISPPSALSCFRAFVLNHLLAGFQERCEHMSDPLELVGSALPFPP